MNDALKEKPSISEPEQREITRLCMMAAQLIMQHGAESALVESITVRLGLALGLDAVDLGVTANALALTTFSSDHCITTVRRILDHGINMHVVTEVQRAMLQVEKNHLDAAQTRELLEAVKPLRYPKWQVSIMVGLSCASFAYFMGADLASCALTSVASCVAMTVRQFLAKHHFNPLVNFAVTAFVATSIACLGVNSPLFQKPELAMAASVLLLIPGFPLINGLSDMVKGHVNTGLARWTIAMLLIMSSSVGIVLALILWRVKIWI
jgi:uncharacterized membrane protein YjjP (DUF1212 family)